MTEKVVITGMGVMSCLSLDVDEFWEKLLAGESGISMLEKVDTSDLPTKFGGEIKNFEPTDFMDKRLANRMDPFDQYCMAATKKALKHANLTSENMSKETKENTAVIIGSGIGGMRTFFDNCERLIKKGPRKVRPTFIPGTLTDMASGRVAAEHGFMGMNYSISSACATSSHSLMTAYDALKLGRCELAIAGGGEGPMVGISFAGFNACKALSLNNENFKTASKPFDANRNGFVMSEGAGILVLETESHAKKRGANILAELAGAGASCDAYDDVQPREDAEGIQLSMNRAIKNAGIKKEDISYVNTHGTSTPAGDVAECFGIEQVMGDHKDNIVVNSTKSLIGHSLGAAGGMEAIVCVKSLIDQKIHKSANIDTIDPAIKLRVNTEAEDRKMTYVMSNSFGFGGHNCSLIFKKYDN